MRRLTVFLGLALMACAASARAQDTYYPGDGSIARAEVKAKSAAAACIKELGGGKSAAACTRYHAAAIDAMGQQSRRQAWCSTRMSEASNFIVVRSCLTSLGQNLGIDTVESLERKVDKKAWKKFDDQMANYSGR